MKTSASIAAAAVLAAIALPSIPTLEAAPPEGFTRTSWPGDWGEIVGVVPTGDGRFVSWDKAGLAWMVGPDGQASVEPLLDIRDEVGNWRDHGMLGFAVDPDFTSNGHVYALYVVDRHHLLFAGTPGYDPEADDYFAATIGRVTRFTATAESDRSQVDPSSRSVLLGESIEAGLPILHQSHATGSLAFGRDGTLMISMGDSASYGEVDTGGQVEGGWVDQALEDGIISPREDLGAYRAQLIDSLAGKILRIDPETGDGVASNPFFASSAPRLARSRVWALGLRNGFRITVAPGTGSTDPAAGDPGTILYGDVGWSTREEAGLVRTGGENLGWPLFEGLDPNGGYWGTDVRNNLVANPLGDAQCPSHPRFRDLLVEAGRIPSNPCDPAWKKPSDWDGADQSRQWAGWTGDDYLDFGGNSGQWIQFEIDVPDRKPRRYGIRWANGGASPRPVDLLVDGGMVGNLDIDPQGSWINWTIDWIELSLSPGTHTLRLVTTTNNGPNIDCLETPDLAHTPLNPGVSFNHRRPEVEFRHNAYESRVPNFDSEGTAGFHLMNDPSNPVAGPAFGGNSVTGGTLVEDSRWPAEWRGMFFADYIFGWMRVARLDGEGNPLEIKPFDATAGAITSIVHDPVSGDLIAVRYDQNPMRYTPPAPPCPADLDGDGTVGGADIGLLLAAWGGRGPADLDGDGTVGGADIGLVLAAWGDCAP
ncbi:MAG: carbohydrate-binding protein [Phycisphaera sp.]|nr:carbohydrate-binding protein [Phycisphaera sp.]